MLIRDGASVSRKDRSRPIPTLRGGSSGSENNALRAGEQGEHSENLSELQRFEAALWAQRNRWSIDRHKLPNDAEGWLLGHGFGSGKLDKNRAAVLLAKAFAAIDREAECPRNSLGLYAQAGGQ